MNETPQTLSFRGSGQIRELRVVPEGLAWRRGVRRTWRHACWDRIERVRILDKPRMMDIAKRGDRSRLIRIDDPKGCLCVDLRDFGQDAELLEAAIVRPALLRARLEERGLDRPTLLGQVVRFALWPAVLVMLALIPILRSEVLALAAAALIAVTAALGAYEERGGWEWRRWDQAESQAPPS